MMIPYFILFFSLGPVGQFCRTVTLVRTQITWHVFFTREGRDKHVFRI
jgi:hypothetical protein